MREKDHQDGLRSLGQFEDHHLAVLGPQVVRLVVTEAGVSLAMAYGEKAMRGNAPAGQKSEDGIGATLREQEVGIVRSLGRGVASTTKRKGANSGA